MPDAWGMLTMSESKLIFFKNLSVTSASTENSIKNNLPENKSAWENLSREDRPQQTHPEKESSGNIHRLEPSTCTEAETFVLQVLDDSMEPEFDKHCMIVIDPTGLATDGSYVFAHRDVNAATQNNERVNDRSNDQVIGQSKSQVKSQANSEDPEALVEQFQFRQLRRTDDNAWLLCPLNDAYPSETTASDLSEIVGVIVQRAGTRRRYHKRYD